MKIKLKVNKKPLIKTVTIIFGVGVLVMLSLFAYRGLVLNQQVTSLQTEKVSVEVQLETIKSELDEIKNQDQVKINQDLNEEVKNIQQTYTQAVSTYEKILDFKETSDNTNELDEMFAQALSSLSDRDYTTADETLSNVSSKIAEEQAAIAAAAAPKPEENVPVQNTPPGSGYSRQQVQTDAGTFTVSIIAADIGSTKVIVDTASGGDCGNDCPVLSLADYVSRNGAYAGVNGSYFCPATYPSCAGKTNTFDTLLMNKDKTYFNSDNNVYSNNPAVIFGGSYVRFVGAASQWGRDTGIDSMISNYPLLVSAGNVVFGGDDDPKKGSKGSRSFVADKGNMIYIGVVHNATVAESARVMKALGMSNALNLDDGGSTALWSGGYKVGPGRNLPNVILFVGK